VPERLHDRALLVRGGCAEFFRGGEKVKGSKIMARYIDADILKEKIEQALKEPNYQHDGEDWGVGLCMASIIVSDMTTADVEEVRHGEWISLEPEIGLFGCSICEHKILRAKCNYCPNCGAEMDGESNA